MSKVDENLGKAARTPGEWKVGAGAGISATVNGRIRLVAEAYAPEGRKGEMEANAERIVLCCNCHDDLVAALKALLSDNLGPQIDDGANWDACCDMAKAALAKAGEK